MSSASQAGAARPSRAASRASNAPEPAGPRAPSRAGTQHEEEQVEDTLTANPRAFLGDDVPERPELTNDQVNVSTRFNVTDEALASNINWGQIGATTRDAIIGASRNAANGSMQRSMTAVTALQSGVNTHINRQVVWNEYLNAEVRWIRNRLTEKDLRMDAMQDEIDRAYADVNDLSQVVDLQKDLIQAYKDQVAALQLHVQQGNRGKATEPPTFKGGEDGISLHDWLNHMAVYFENTGVVLDSMRISQAMSRLRGPAQKLLNHYWEKLRNKEPLGTYKEFEDTLASAYGKRDPKYSAAEELKTHWANKDLARKDFMEWISRYRVLADIIGSTITDETHITEIKEILETNIKVSLVPLEMQKLVPTTWQKYLDMVLEMYKVLHPQKTTEKVFKDKGKAKESGGDKSDNKGKTKEVNAVQSADSNKKEPCGICLALKRTGRAKTHVTADCFDNPSRKAAGTSSSPAQGSSSGQGQSGQGQRSGGGSTGSTASKKNNKGAVGKFKARVVELQNELTSLAEALEENDEGGSTPTAQVNTAHIEEIVDDNDDKGQRQGLYRPPGKRSNPGAQTASDFLQRM